MDNTYEIFTDASFDDYTKLATYSVVIIKNKKLLKAFGKKTKVEILNSTECEIFAIFQAMTIIESNLMQDKAARKIYLSTDASGAEKFFKEKCKTNIFKRDCNLHNQIKETYSRVHDKMKEKNIDFELKSISRKNNKTAHRYSYRAFKNYKDKDPISNIIKKKKELKEIHKMIELKIVKVLIYLFVISNKEKIILKTQYEIARELNMSNTNINRMFYKLRKLKILEKKGNGKYFLTI